MKQIAIAIKMEKIITSATNIIDDINKKKNDEK